MTKLGIALRGMAMGIAEIIPGVSGGTIAFVTGIYKTLIDAIKAVDHNLLAKLLKGKFKEVWTDINGAFLLPLIVGMGIGVISGVFGITHLIETYPEAVWSLFFGLILASVPFMITQMKDKKGVHIMPFIIGALVAYLICNLSPAEGSTNYLYVFCAGAIAISALVLPGISGSFILLMLGLYTIILPTIKSFLSSPELSEFILLGVFASGCIVGLIGFSRVVSAAFDKYHDGTIALMSGFLLGSLTKIWPWRNPLQLLNKKASESSMFSDLPEKALTLFNQEPDAFKILKEENVFPQGYFSDPQTTICIIAFLLGLILIYLLHISQRKSAVSTS